MIADYALEVSGAADQDVQDALDRIVALGNELRPLRISLRAAEGRADRHVQGCPTCAALPSRHCPALWTLRQAIAQASAREERILNLLRRAGR